MKLKGQDQCSEAVAARSEPPSPLPPCHTAGPASRVGWPGCHACLLRCLLVQAGRHTVVNGHSEEETCASDPQGAQTLWTAST